MTRHAEVGALVDRPLLARIPRRREQRRVDARRAVPRPAAQVTRGARHALVAELGLIDLAPRLLGEWRVTARARVGEPRVELRVHPGRAGVRVQRAGPLADLLRMTALALARRQRCFGGRELRRWRA